MAFLRQLQLLLWKNGLGMIRRPLWSVTLIVWPIIIFIIIAVTRYQFPPVLRETCYVGPRNLPSTGFFPFLETLMCNTDSHCHNTSRSAYSSTSRNKRSTQLSEDSPLSKLFQGQELSQFANLSSPDHDPTQLINLLYNIFGSPSGQPEDAINATIMGINNQPMINLTESAAKLKTVICTLSLPLVNTSSSDHFVVTLVTFCRSNSTVFEEAINTLNTVLIELMTSQPEELAKWTEKAVHIFDQLQNESSLWESFITFPQIFHPTSPDQFLSDMEKLLISLQRVLNIAEQSFPEIKDGMLSVHPFLVAGISLTRYTLNWPGKSVSIRFGDVVVENETLWQMVSNIEIPLDKAIALTFNREMVRDYVCKNSTNPMLMAACATGTLDMFLGWICPNKLAQQTLLAWSKYVAPHDLGFVKGLLHTLGGLFGGSATPRTARSIETQPQNIEEELFLEVGKVVMEILQLSPEADAIVQQILRAGYQSMKMATQAVMNVEEIMDNVVKDVTTVRMIYHTLLTNQSQTTIWLSDALNSVSEIVVKVLAGEHLTCELILRHFEWLFSIESIKLEVWRSFICGNRSTIEQTLLKDWMPLTENVQELYCVFQGNVDYNVTLPMVLSEWHELFNKSQHFGVFLERLVKEWGGAYLMDWMLGNSSASHVTTSLQQSVYFFMVNLGQKFEQSHLWPEAKGYFLMANWILNYNAGVTTQPNCSMSMENFGIKCDTEFNWHQFVEAFTQALLSPSEKVLISCVKGSVQLLQQVYGDFYKHQVAAYLNCTIEGGDMLSAVLVNLLNQLNDFVLSLTTLPDESFSKPYVMVPLYQKLLESTGLKPLLPLILSDGPVNISQVLEVASKLGRSNQAIFTFNESDPTMAQLEQYIMQFLSTEGNLSMSLYLSMSHTLLTYSNYFSPEYVAKVRKAIQPFTNQTSAGIVEAILRAVELLKTIMDAPNGESSHIIFGYIRQLQEFLVSLFRMQRFEQIMLPNGQFSPAQVTDLQLLSDIFNLLTPETIMNLTQAGPEAAQLIIIQKYIETLPAQLRPEAAEFLKKFVALQSQIAQCDPAQNCLTGISEIFDFLDEILKMTLNTNGNFSINIAPTNMYLGREEYKPIAFAFFSLILPSHDAAYVKMVQETLKFISLLVSQPNISVSDIQEALTQTDLTIGELNYLVTQLGATNVNDLIEKITKLSDSQQCFEQKISPELIAHCAVELVDSLSGFLTHFPSLQNETSILSLLPIIVNKTITNMINTNFSSPQNALAEALKATLANIKINLQLNNLSTPEIMNEIKVLESLIKLVVNHEPLNGLDIPMNEFYVGEAQLKILLWHLEKLENVTSSSSFSNLLYPFFRITQMQVALQLAQMDLNNFISEQISNLTKSLEYPIDEDGANKIGHVTIAILQHVVKFVVINLEAQNAPAFIFGYDPPINMTVVNATVLQINNYIKLIQQWMIQSNFVAWGNSSNILSVTVNDIYHLLQSTLHFSKNDQQDYFYAIGNITQTLNKALMVAEQPNGLQSDRFLAAILEAVQSALQLLTRETGPLPPSVQQNILEVVKNTVWLAVHSEMSYAQSLNTTLHILQNLEFIVKQTASEEVAQYLLAALKVATTYFQTVSTANGPDNWNQIILNELKTLESLLPPNCTAQFYISAIINITQFILQPVQGNMSLWTQGASKETVPLILAEAGKLLNMFWPLFMGGSGSPLTASSAKGFADLPVILEEVMTGQAINETWTKLQTVVEILLTSFAEPEMSEHLACIVKLFEKTIGAEVKTRKAQNDLIVGLQKPVMTLMTEITRSLNGSQFNMSEISESLELAIENTLMVFDQTNDSLNCQEALKYWEPVREAAGLSHSSVAMWCNISIQPVIDGYVNSMSQCASQNWSCTELGPLAIDAAAARIVVSVRSLYNTEIIQSHVTDKFFEAFCNQLSALVEQPLSLQAKLSLYKQIQVMQIQSSLKTIELLSEQLGNNFPFLKPYVEAVEKMLVHIVKNNQEIEDISEEFFSEAAMILLYSLNITSNDLYHMMSGNYSSEEWVEMVKNGLKTLIDMKVFGEDPMLYQTFEKLLASNGTKMIIQKVTEMFSWFTSTQAQGFELLIQALTKIQELFSPLLSALSHMDVDLPPNLQLLDDLTSNMISLIRQVLTTSGLSMDNHHNMMSQPKSNHNGTRVRRRREAAFMPVRGPMDDFIDFFSIDYHSMFQGLMEPPTTSEIAETVHVFFANPDLRTVMKGATKDMGWGLESSREETIDAALGMASLLTVPGTEFSSLELWMNAINMLPDGFPYASLLKNVTRAIAMETPENVMLMQATLRTLSMLLQTSPTDPQFTEQFNQLDTQVCKLEKTDPIQVLLQGLSLKPGVLCNGFVPGLQILAEGLLLNMSTLLDNIFEVFIGEPRLYNLKTNWTALITDSFGLDISRLSAFNLTSTAPGVVTIGEMVRNKTAFMLDLQKLGFGPAVVYLLTEAALPDNNVQILSWLLSLRLCNSTDPNNMGKDEKILFESFCSMSAEQWYSFLLLMAQHLNMEKFIYRMVLPAEIQSLVQTMLHMAETIINMMKTMLPAVRQLEEYLISIESLAANNDVHQLSRSQRTSISNKVTFVTISRALCSQGILAIFGVAKNPKLLVAPPTFTDSRQREEMIERFKIPRDATDFCTNLYLDMVNTTGGAIAWAFLKPMLMGKILFTPDTPQTRAIMSKANSTLQQLADLRYYSQDWIKSSDYIVKSSEMLSQTLPMLQNSLGNSFVKNFIEMQTGINVGTMQETLNSFSNMTLLLDKNKELLGQITTLSTLMVDLSSCIKFDRYQGYNTQVELNSVAQELAKNRDLYASIIFKLPKDSDSYRERRAASSTTALPPKVHYTIRMHMDNVMRTDRVREPYFVKDNRISAQQTLRYNRGFIYLQETIDRAIIEIQSNQKVTDTAVQIQPFPYPCYMRDEYLEAISFVFPLLLMIAWILFVADFVKKLVHEREMKLHEYMKMMGVNPLSHFFAWFLESAAYLLLTIFFLTLVLKYGLILPHSDGFLLFLYLCDYGLSVLGFSFLVSTLFNKTYIAALSGSLLYVLCFFPFIMVMAMESNLSFSQKSQLGLFSPAAFSYASQYVSRYEAQGEGIQWSNSYTSPLAGDTASFGWLCWLMLIDAILYFIIGAYIRMVFPGESGLPYPWYFPLTASFWINLCGCKKTKNTGRGLFFCNIMQTQQSVCPDTKGKGNSDLSSKAGEDFSDLPVGVALYGLTKLYGQQVAIENLNVAFYEGHVTSLLGHNGAGKTTTMSILTGLFPPSSGTVEVYGRDMQVNLEDVRKELGVCMQYDVLFEHMTAKEHLLLYGQIKAPHWSKRELHEQVRTILEETGMYAHRHKRVGTLSGGMKRKLSISIAFIGGSRLVVLDEPTTGVDPCSRRSIWDIVIQHKKGRTIIMSTHHLDEAEVLSDRIAFLERGGLKCCGSPFHLKDQLGQGYKLTLTKKMNNGEATEVDNAELKAFVQAHVPEARLKEAQGSDLVYLLPPFSSSNASSYRSLLTALDSNLDALQLGCYGISDTTLEEVFLHLTHGSAGSEGDSAVPTISETVSDTDSMDSYPDSDGSMSNFGDKLCATGTPSVSGMKLAWQQMTAILIKRFHHSRRDWKGLISQILLPVLFVVCAMGLGNIKNDLRHYPVLELSPALYNIGPSYSFFSDHNSSKLADHMLSFPGLDNACLQKSNDQVCTRSTGAWSAANGSKMIGTCKCVRKKEVCGASDYVPPHKQIPSSQIVYNLTGLNVENYLVATADEYIRNRYGGYDFGLPLPPNLKIDVKTVPKNRTLSKVWFNPEGHHTMPAYLNSLNNLILRSNLPADKDPSQYAISVSSHPYFGRPDDEDAVVQGMLQILVAMCVLAGYSITTASFAIYEVSEHHSGSKRLQHIAGVSEPFYWAVNFFYDMVIYLIPVTLTVGVIAAFQIPAFTERQNLGAVTLLLVLFGFSTFPWMYLLSSVFKDTEMAFISYVCINLFLSINTIIPTSILYFMRQITKQNAESLKVIFDRMSYAFLIFPQFNFGNGLLELARMNIEVQILSGYDIDAYKNPFSTEALGWMFISSFTLGVVLFSLRLLLNKFIIRKIRRLVLRGKAVPLVPCVEEDDDVAAEHLRVSTGAASSDVLQVNQLTKVYQYLNKKVFAVQKLSLGVPAGECFGLLGVNGAGKTTTFKMLTGDVGPTDGSAQIRDKDGRLVDIIECRNQGINIGYCPQEDALDDLLTGEEHLQFYASLHGISKREITGVVNHLLRKLGLNYYRSITTKGYSCGTRRKLSTALALVGHPQILLLDEPSSGMDPRTKRHLWKIISNEVKGKCAVVLTSHSMEECEALCGRLAIMVKGQFRCLGSLQHIKNRFGSGFTVKMYLAKASSDADAITRFMQSRFPSTYLKEQHSNMVEYHVPVAPGGVADIFGQLESSKEYLEIQHFSVSQTTLDEVFINFAMGKIGMETIPIDDEFDDDSSMKDVEA